MALPKKKHEIYPVTIPSTGEKIKFRPFTVKEEKILTIAKESEDEETITNAIIETIENCLCGEIDIKNNLATFDVEYILTQIRAKSVGEEIELLMSCDIETHRKTPVKIDITKAQVEFPDNHEKKIHLYDDVGIMMKYPNIGDLLSQNDNDPIESILYCMDYIYDDNEIYYKYDHTKEELIDFIESLERKQLEDIKTKFFDSSPKFQIEIEYECIECGKKYRKVVSGLKSFFI